MGGHRTEAGIWPEILAWNTVKHYQLVFFRSHYNVPITAICVWIPWAKCNSRLNGSSEIGDMMELQGFRDMGRSPTEARPEIFGLEHGECIYPVGFRSHLLVPITAICVWIP
ncbi:hypothetical protein HAX54_048343 [Datura stramonium]|uniref:Uncharacterized protein n=1 Tax=Datura stramonium TaxID=4076 RepID=A0ABS8STX1_DATST|nr:hypothetical protein [Datura stramonium]